MSLSYMYKQKHHSGFNKNAKPIKAMARGNKPRSPTSFGLLQGRKLKTACTVGERFSFHCKPPLDLHHHRRSKKSLKFLGKELQKEVQAISQQSHYLGNKSETRRQIDSIKKKRERGSSDQQENKFSTSDTIFQQHVRTAPLKLSRKTLTSGKLLLQQPD